MSKPYQKELSRHPSQSVTWVRILENGDFEVEFYDYSCDEDSSFNHDYAIKNIVKSGDVSHAKTLLGANSDLNNEEFLKPVRRHWALGYKSPMAFELAHRMNELRLLAPCPL